MKDKFLSFLGLCKRAGKLLQGYNKCEDGLKKGTVRLIILSKDLSLNTIDKFNNYSNRYSVKILIGYNEEELGNALGLPEIKVLGVTDENMKNKLLELWEEK